MKQEVSICKKNIFIQIRLCCELNKAFLGILPNFRIVLPVIKLLVFSGPWPVTGNQWLLLAKLFEHLKTERLLHISNGDWLQATVSTNN